MTAGFLIPDEGRRRGWTGIGQSNSGLKLEAGRGPVEVVVIDRLEKPTVD
jgi:uncharacterized protein (TIGR03435 family)